MEFSVGEPSSAGMEALSVLRAVAEPAAGPLADQLAARALRITERADFALAQDALRALLRRLSAARESRAIVARAGRAPGWYRVGRRGVSAPHHDVLLTSVAPIDGSCSCPDFARASLGLCEHIFSVAAAGAVCSPVATRPPLRWDPVRPLTGAGDWLERVRWGDPDERVPCESRVRRLFHRSDGDFSSLPPAVIARPQFRLAAVEALIDMVRGLDRVAEPAIPALLERDRDLLTHTVRHGMTPRELRRHCEGLKQKLYLYQREGLRRFLERGRLLLADDAGLGKTGQAIAACHVLVASGRVRRGLVVVPAPLESRWIREWQRFTDLPLIADDRHSGIATRTARRAGVAILLVSDERLARDLPQLRQFGPDIVVIDDAHRIKNWASAMAPHLKLLAPAWRLIVAATPMEDRLDELAAIMEWVDESALEPRWRLASCRAPGNGRSALSSARTLETLRQRLAPTVVSRRRREVLEQLPPHRDICIPIPLTRAQRAAHDALNQPIARIVSGARRRPPSEREIVRLKTLLARQRVICNGMAHSDFLDIWPSIERRRPSAALLESLASPKLGELRELVTAIAIAQERKVVVFSRWRRMVRLAAWAVSDILRAAGLRAVLSTGDESARRRAQSIASFRDDGDVRVLFATDAGGAGLELPPAASCCIHLDVPWDARGREQRTRSVGGPGQEHAVDTYTLVAENGIEGRIAALVAERRSSFDEVFDGTGDSVGTERARAFLSGIEVLMAGGRMEGEVDGEPEPLDAWPDAGEGDEADEAVPDHVPAGSPAPGSVASLFRQIEVRNDPGGGVSFEAPAAAAAALAEVLQGVARLFAHG